MVDPEHPAGLSTAAQRSRQPVNAVEVTAQLRHRDHWAVRAVAETGSTNDDLAALVEAERPAGRVGSEVGRVLIAELQRAGKGRRGRQWSAPPGSGLTMSVLLDLPEVPLMRRSWIGAIAGLCLIRAVDQVSGLPAALKWPNDLLVGGRKCAGLLAESTSEGVIIGMGLNVSLQTAELPRPDATSLLLEDAVSLDRTELAAAVLDELADWLDRWRAAAGDPDRSGLRTAYRSACATLGQQVRVELSPTEAVVGTAVDITPDGALVVDTATGRRTFNAGDVHHLLLAPELPRC